MRSKWICFHGKELTGFYFFFLSIFSGLESLLDAVFESKGKGLFSLLSFLAEAKKSFEKGVNPQFAEFDKPLSEALNKIIKLVNHPQYVMPDGILTWKLYGKNKNI